MLRRRVSLAATMVALAPVVAACSGGSSSPPQKVASDDERGSIGVPPPAIDYCQKSGFTIENGRCVFPDGTSCEQWSFYYATCGQAHSYCDQHGGQVSSETRDMGTWTAAVAVCDLGGKRCDEDTFFRTGKCD